MSLVLRRVSAYLTKHTLIVLLSLAAIIGVLFVFIVPPWEHYDEPGHFEYAWLVANRSEWPKGGDYDQAMRREVGASMLERDFHEYSIYHLLNTGEPISIIIPQTGDVPLYYFLVSLPLRLVKYSDITFQLYVARFASLGLFLVTIALAYKTTLLLFKKGHPLTWMTPLFLIFLPGFVDIMTAVNNDVASITCFTFFLYTSVLLFTKGFSLKRVILLFLAVVLCLLAKLTGILAVPLSVVVILLAPAKKLKVVKVVVLCLGLLAGITLLIFSFQLTSPAYFYAENDIFLPVSMTLDEAPLGTRVIAQEPGEDYGMPFFLPFLAKEVSDAPTLNLGAWIWADAPVTIRSPKITCWNLDASVPFTNEAITVSDSPTYYTFNVVLNENPGDLCWVSFQANPNQDTSIYWDGIILTEGVFDNNSSPTFIDDQTNNAIWDGVTVENLIKNGSGEKIWPVFSSLIQTTILHRFDFSFSNILSVIDPGNFVWYYKSATAQVFRSFWGIFGWGNVFFLGTHPYRYFIAFSLIGFGGVLIGLRRKLTKAQRKSLLLFSLVIVLQSVMVIFRGVGTWFDHLFIPSARYLYPAALPTSLILSVGYYGLIHFLIVKLHLSKTLLFIIFICALIGQMVWAILSILNF